MWDCGKSGFLLCLFFVDLGVGEVVWLVRKIGSRGYFFEFGGVFVHVWHVKICSNLDYLGTMGLYIIIS